MKAFIVLAVVVAAAHAGVVGYGAAPIAAYSAPVAVGVAETGSSQQYRSEDGIGNYNFGYDEAHTTGGSFRRESGNNLGVKVGSYGLHAADGRVRVVNYVADGAGFRAAIQTNEPGVGAQDPAATAVNKAGVVAAAAPVLAAPAVASYAAPVVGAYSAGITHGGVVAPAYAGIAAPAYAGIAAPVVGGYGAIAHGGVVAPAVAGYAAGYTHGGIVAPVVGAQYSSAINHAGIVGGIGYAKTHHII